MNAEMKTVVVTGASGDIGLAISNRLIADGFFVAACSHNHHDRVASAFTDMQNIALFDLNLRESSIKACATAIIKARGPIAGLVVPLVATGSLFRYDSPGRHARFIRGQSFWPSSVHPIHS